MWEGTAHRKTNFAESLRLLGNHLRSYVTSLIESFFNLRKNVLNSIQIKNLIYSWSPDHDPILKISQLNIIQGEVVYLYGPSGSGKTTLLNLVAGVLEPQSGDIVILDQSLKAMKAQERDQFRGQEKGFVFQLFNLIPYLSVLENILLPIQFSPHKLQKIHDKKTTPKDEAYRLLKELGLFAGSHSFETNLQKPASQLSVGQMQRVAVARALMGSPQILIADEPTSSLDSDAREDFLGLLFKECRQNATTLLFVSHDRSLSRLLDRLLSLSEINDVQF
jgi:putative ABC transport system ATP-binding protein